VVFGNKTRIITNFHTTMELERIFEEVRVDQASGKVSLVDVAAIVTGKDKRHAAETIRCILGRDSELDVGRSELDASLVTMISAKSPKTNHRKQRGPCPEAGHYNTN